MLAAVLAGGLSLPGAARAQASPFPVLPSSVEPGDGRVMDCTQPGGEGRVRCGVFRVDEDGEPGGRTIDLHFVIADALADDPAPDPILFFNGGPGVAVVPPPSVMARGVGVMRPLRERRDLVLVDLRGTGLSGGLSCETPFPGGLESRFGTLFPLDHVAACRDSLEDRADPTRYTTATSVDDLEALRRWLGYPAVNLMASSYGTRVAQVWMRRHPEAVRTAVLNGVTPVDQPGYVEMAGWLQESLDRLVAECEAQAECGAAYPRFRDQLEALFRRFAAGPVPVTVEGRTVPFSAGDLAYAIRGLLYSSAADIPYLVDRADGGDLDPLVQYYVARTDWVAGEDGLFGNHLSVLCAEDIAPVTEADVSRATAGTFMGDHVIRSYMEACELWPHADLPETFFRPVASDVPTLLLSGGRDPTTPASGGDRVAEHLPRSLHVVVPNAGHGVSSPCILRLVRTLFETGSIQAVDPACVEEAPPVQFRTP